MGKNIIYFIVFLGLICLSEQQGNCNNPIYNTTACVTVSASSSTGNSAGSNFCLIQRSLSTPASKPNVNICPDISVGSPSCCSSSAYNSISSSFSSYSSALQSQLSQTTVNINASFAALVSLTITPTLSTSGLSSSQQSALIAAYYNVLSTTLSSVNYTQAQACNQAQLDYQAGLACLSCRPDYSSYVYYNAEGQITFNLDQNTCNSLAAGCSGYYLNTLQNSVKLFGSYQNLANLLVSYNASANVFDVFGVSADGNYAYLANFTESFTIPIACPNNNCSAFICSSYAQGLNIGSSSSSSDLDTSSSTGFTKKDQTFELELLEGIKSDSIRAMRNVQKRASGGATNVYSSNGYPASSNGQNSHLVASSSASSTPSAYPSHSAGAIKSNWMNMLSL